MINSSYQNYGIFSSGQPDITTLKQAINLHGVKSVLSLDRDAGNVVRELIEKYKLPLKQNLVHIDPSSPAESGRNVFNNISSLTQDKPVLIHCKQGKDRTGFAIAAYLIKNGIMNAPSAIQDVTNKVGYGKGGISDVSKNTLDNILGFVKSKVQQKAEDVSSADDYTNTVNFDGGFPLLNDGEWNTFPAITEQTNSLSLLDYSGNENALGIKSSIRRGKLLKLAGEDIYSLIEKITDKLYSYKEEDLKEMLSLMKDFDDVNNADIPIVGEWSNYDGVPFTHLTGPSCTPGGSSSVALVEKAEPGGVVQI